PPAAPPSASTTASPSFSRFRSFHGISSRCSVCSEWMRLVWADGEGRLQEDPVGVAPGAEIGEGEQRTALAGVLAHRHQLRELAREELEVRRLRIQRPAGPILPGGCTDVIDAGAQVEPAGELVAREGVESGARPARTGVARVDCAQLGGDARVVLVVLA